ncbi:MAG: Fic family protein [Candidatus Dojkabacteria bacterium]
MFEPKFTYTDRLVSQLIKLEGNKISIHSLDLNYNVKYKLTLNAKATDIFHIARMLENEVSLKDAEKIATGIKPDGIDESKFVLLQNFRNVLEFNRSQMVDSYAEMDFAILTHLNKLVTANWSEAWNAKFRAAGDELDEKFDDWSELRDKKLEPAEVTEEMGSLVQWYKDITPTLTPLVRFAILLYGLIEIFPFIAGNKFTILAVADYLMLKNGLASKAYVSVIRNFDSNMEKYLEAIHMSRKNYDLAYWLEAFIESVNKDLLEIKEGINDYIMEDERAKKQPFLDLNPRQLKVLRYLQNVPYIKREDYCHMMDVSTMTAFRDVNDLVRKKLLKVEGQGRGTKYRLSTM